MNGFREYFREYVHGVARGTIKYRGKRVGLRTVESYQTALKHYEEFCLRKEQLYLDEVDLYNFTSRKDRVAAKKKANQHWADFLTFLQKRVGVASQEVYLAKIRCCLSHLEEEEMMQIPFNVQAPEVKHETLIWDNSMTEILLAYKPRRRTEKCFQLQIHLCCRWSELKNLSFEKEIIDGEEVYQVNYLQDKTGTRVRPIVPKHIWEQSQGLKVSKYIASYNGSLRHWLSKFPEFNEYVTFSKQMKDGTLKTVRKKWCEMATSHDLRRAGINRLQVMGISDTVIREMYSGHKDAAVFNKHYVAMNKEKILSLNGRITKNS